MIEIIIGTIATILMAYVVCVQYKIDIIKYKRKLRKNKKIK